MDKKLLWYIIVIIAAVVAFYLLYNLCKDAIQDSDYEVNNDPNVTKYTISYSVTGQGAVSVRETAAAGTTVKIVATPSTGYELTSITENGTSLTLTTDDDGVGKASFTMPESAVTLVVTFTAV